MSPPIVARDGNPSFPEYEKILTSARLVIVPGLVLAEVDYFLRENRAAMRKLASRARSRVAGLSEPWLRCEGNSDLEWLQQSSICREHQELE